MIKTFEVNEPVELGQTIELFKGGSRLWKVVRVYQVLETKKIRFAAKPVAGTTLASGWTS